MTLDEFLQRGGEIHHAPLSGTFALVLKGEAVSGMTVTAEDFVPLKDSGRLVKTDEWGQGHWILHGKVNVYKLKTQVRFDHHNEAY
jgi:hypothetical protein